MSTASEKTFKPDSSQGEFWGGYMIDAWFYKFLALFPITGFLGIDQLALRSPLTALLKLLVNIFFWGAWYIYDILQITLDNTFVAKYGMSTPYGQKGNGYRFFKDLTEQNVNEFASPSEYNGGIVATLLFVAYFLLSPFIGFTGVPMMIAGDFNGGILKLASNFLFGIPTFFYIVAPFIEIFSIASLGKTNVPHSWPLYPWFTRYEDYPAVNLIGEEGVKKKLEEHTKLYETTPKQDPNPIKKLLVGGGEAPPPPIKKVLELPLLQEYAIRAAQTVGIAISAYPPIAAFQTIGAAKEGVQAASDIAKITANALKAKVADPVAADKLLDKLLGVSQVNQTGGGAESTSFDTILFGGMLALLVGGFAAAFFRKITLPKRKDDNEYPRKIYERNDTPPLAGGV